MGSSRSPRKGGLGDGGSPGRTVQAACELAEGQAAQRRLHVGGDVCLGSNDL